MSFFWPNVLWLLAIPVILLGLEFRRRRGASTSVNHPKIVRAEAGTKSLHLAESLIPVSDRRSRWRILLGLTFAILALARPQWGHLDEPVFDQAREIIIALDLSRSMLSPDVKPTRLDRAKLLVQSLLERLSGERVGLIVFSGTAFLQSPLSSDYEILNEFLPQMSPDYLPEGGTNYSDLINTAISAFGNGSGADRYMIILSDGEATDDDWKSAAEKLKGKGIRVIGLGVGTAQGAMIPDGSGGFVKDERGAVVLSKIEPATLKALASMTNGTYADASSWVDLAQLLKATVDKGAKGHFREERNVRLVERYQWPLGAALIFFLWSFWQEFSVYPRSRDIKLRGAANRTTPPPLPKPPSSAATATVAHLLALGFFLLAAHPRLQALTETAPPATAPTPVPPPGVTPGLPSPADPAGSSHGDALAAPLTQMVTQFSARDHLSAKDYAELAQTTVTYGERLREGHKPILEGPLHDGLSAVERGKALDPHAADWEKLKASLEELLQPPPPTPTPPPQKQKNQDKKNDQDKNDQSKNDQDKSDQNKSSDQDQKSKDDQSKNDQAKSEDQKQNDQSKQNASKNQNQDSAKNAQNNSSKADNAQATPTPANQNNNSENASPHPQDASSGFGNMEKKPANPPTPAPVPASPETQKVGGVTQENPADKNDNPALAIPLEKLQQVKDGDSPVRLQQLMRGNQKTPAKQGKNW